jgi:predicted metal-dependent phosphoesterase TrpH
LKTDIRVDLHVHSYYSKDSLITPTDLVFWAKKRGLSAVAVTDHDTIEGALKMAKESNFPIVPGMEISSLDGHIVAFNISEKIPKDLSAPDTVDRIHEAGGIAVAVHPFALLKNSLGKAANASFDAIETINASAFPFKRNATRATNTALLYKKPSIAGTDAHYGPAIGYAYTVVDSQPNSEDILKAVLAGKCKAFGEAVPLALKIAKQYHYYLNKNRTGRES